MAPTSDIPGATYYTSFEDGIFPNDGWSVSTDDPTGGGSWDLSALQAYTGRYSIRSPFLHNANFTRRSANVTLTTYFPAAGNLTFHHTRVDYPLNDLRWYVDGVFVEFSKLGLVGWNEERIELDSTTGSENGGVRSVTWEYVYNPEGNEELVPEPTEGDLMVFLDEVYFIPEENASPRPTLAPTGSDAPTGDTPTTDPLDSPTESPTFFPSTWFPTGMPTPPPV